MVLYWPNNLECQNALVLLVLKQPSQAAANVPRGAARNDSAFGAPRFQRGVSPVKATTWLGSS